MPKYEEDLKQDMDELRTKLKKAKKELEQDLFMAIQERVNKFKLRHGIAPSEISVLIHTENVFGRGPVYHVAGINVEIPFNLDD